MTYTIITGVFPGYPGFGHAHYYYPHGYQPLVIPTTWQGPHIVQGHQIFYPMNLPRTF